MVNILKDQSFRSYDFFLRWNNCGHILIKSVDHRLTCDVIIVSGSGLIDSQNLINFNAFQTIIRGVTFDIRRLTSSSVTE